MKRPQITQAPWHSCPGNARQHYRVEAANNGNDLFPVSESKGPDGCANASAIASLPEALDVLEHFHAWLTAPDLSPDTLAFMQGKARAVLESAGYTFE